MTNKYKLVSEEKRKLLEFMKWLDDQGVVFCVYIEGEKHPMPLGDKKTNIADNYLKSK